MKKQRFRISENDTIKATLTSKDRNVFALVYDSGFTSIGQVISVLVSRVPYTPAKAVDIIIYNQDKQTSKYITKKVNK